MKGEGGSGCGVEAAGCFDYGKHHQSPEPQPAEAQHSARTCMNSMLSRGRALTSLPTSMCCAQVDGGWGGCSVGGGGCTSVGGCVLHICKTRVDQTIMGG